MATEWARGLAAQAWCTPTTEHTEMDVELAEAFAEIIDSLNAEPEAEQSQEE